MSCPCYAGAGPGGGGPEPLYCIDGGNNAVGVSGTACCGVGMFVTPGPIGSPVHPMCQGQGCDWLINNSTCFDNTAPDDGNDPNLTPTKIDKFDLIGGEKAPGDIGYDPFTDGSNKDYEKISKLREFIKKEIKKNKQIIKNKKL
jgi:hypothetical protein